MVTSKRSRKHPRPVVLFVCFLFTIIYCISANILYNKSIRKPKQEDKAMKSRAERNQMIHEATAAELLDWYDWHRDHFNPLDDETCYNLEELKREIMRRMNK